MNLQDKMIAIIGLGYVGLPLAVEFGKVRPVIGFDIDPSRIAELQCGEDHTLECSPEELQQATQLKYSANAEDLKQAQVFIVTVPTPVDTATRVCRKNTSPSPVKRSTSAIGTNKGDSTNSARPEKNTSKNRCMLTSSGPDTCPFPCARSRGASRRTTRRSVPWSRWGRCAGRPYRR